MKNTLWNKSIVKLSQEIILISFILTVNLHASTPKEKMEHAIESINKECEGYANVITKVMWSAATRKAKRLGKSIPKSYRDSFYKVELKQCVTVNEIQIMEMLKSELSKSDWEKTDGESTLKKLNAELLKTI